MKVSSQRKPKDKKKTKEKKDYFWHFLSGGFLLDENVKKWGPFFLLLAVCAFIVVFNQKNIESKKREIRKIENKYFTILDTVQQNNIFLSPDEALAIEKEAKKRGFIFMDTNVYKMELNNEK